MRKCLTVFFLLLTYSSFSQTLIINKGKLLDANDSIDFRLEVDSLLNYYTFDELKSESITISLDRVEVKRKYTGLDNPNFETFDVTDRLEASAKKIILVQEDTTKLIFRKKINQTFLEYFKIDDNEALVEFKINVEFPNYRYGDDDKERKFFRKNTGSNLGFDCRDTRECFIYFYDRINKSVYTNHFSISNTDIKSNLDAILKEATSDINLVVREDCGSPSNNCDRWTGNNSVRLETPIVEDFTGDGKKDVLGRVYNVYFGDIDWDLTEDEKKMYFSRWALFEAVDVSGDSLVYKLNKYYDQISEGIKVFSLDYNGDGHLDIYTKPDVYHGFQTNKPSGWTRDGFLYINDGSGNFQLSDDDDAIISQTGIKNSEIFQNLVQVDADDELEIVFSENKFDARYIVAHPHIKLTLIDKVGNNYQKNEVELIAEPESGYKILTRNYLGNVVFDLDSDGYKDLLVWYSQNEVKENYIDNSGAYTGPKPLTSSILAQQEKRKIIAFYGSSTGFNLDMNASTTKVLYEYNTIPGMEAYSFEIIEFKEGVNLLIFMDISGGEAFNDFGINYDGPNSKISALKIENNSIQDVTDDIFLDSNNEDYMGARNELLFKDLNNDGLVDMYNWRDIWSQKNITQPSQFFINNGTNFIPYHCASNDFGNGGFDFADFNSDGYYDILYNVDGTFTKSTNIDVAYEVDNDGYLVKKDGVGVLEIIQVLYNDKDDDKIADREDNCIDIDNFDQNDKDKDGLGNKCDPDDDGDEILDINDNCRLTVNPDQLDTDGDGIGDACDPDDDGDGVKDSKDNCPLKANPDQKDTDEDGIGDVCDTDDDGDGVLDAEDNCSLIYNPNQTDTNKNNIGDVCEDFEDPQTVNIIVENIEYEETFDQIVSQYIVDDSYQFFFNQGYDVIDIDNDGKQEFISLFYETTREINKAGIGVFSFDLTENNKLQINLDQVINIDGEPNAIAPEVAHLNKDNLYDIFIPTGNFHGEPGEEPDFYNGTSNRPDFIFYNTGSGYEVDSLDFTYDNLKYAGTHYQKQVQIDSDMEKEIILLPQNNAMEGNGGLVIYDFINKRHELSKEIKSIYPRVSDVLDIDYSSSGNKDLLVISNEKQNNLNNYYLQMYDGSNDGVDFNSDISDIGSFSIDSEWFVPENEDGFKFIIIDNLKILLVWFANSNGIDAQLKAYEISTSNIIDITEYLFGKKFTERRFDGLGPILSDFDSDGDLDFIVEGGYSLENPYILYLNNGLRFQPVLFSESNLGNRFIDLNQDGIMDIISNKNSSAQIINSIINPSDTDYDGIVNSLDTDDDGDGVLDTLDNCPLTANADQLDTDGDGQGDVCDTDDDGDGVLDTEDNCPLTANADQLDTDGDGIGDVCDTDDDGDGVLDTEDNCPLTVNADQLDTDGDGEGDVCDTDDDGDGVLDSEDNCPLTVNPDQEDWNNNGVGDVCGDPKPLSAESITFVDNVYPNPTDDNLRVTLKPGVEVKDLYFIDIGGKKLKPRSINKIQGGLDVNISNLREGIYLLEVVTDNELNKVKIVIAR